MLPCRAPVIDVACIHMCARLPVIQEHPRTDWVPRLPCDLHPACSTSHAYILPKALPACSHALDMQPLMPLLLRLPTSCGGGSLVSCTLQGDYFQSGTCTDNSHLHSSSQGPGM